MLKAFAVTEESDNNGAIMFAGTNIEARRRGADEYNDGQLRGISCRRAPWADEFAASLRVPAAVMIANGWHFECGSCGAVIEEDWLHDEDLPIAGVIGFQHTDVYCSAICEASASLRRAIQRDHERRAIGALEDYVRRRFPSVLFGTKDNWKPHAYASQENGTWQVRAVAVSFEWPGMKIGHATCRIDRGNSPLIGPIRPTFMCCAGDREAFEAWARTVAT